MLEIKNRLGGIVINKSITAIIFTFLLFFIFSASGNAQNTADSDSVKGVPAEFEPNPAYPFGRLNPASPAETAEFSFMIGEFDCKDRVLGQDGKWIESETVWNSAYFVNGGGIQDRYWSSGVVASGTRIFDKNKGKWIVNYFQTFPNYFAGVWEGMKEGEKMIMRAARGENESRLTFHNIRKNGFDWMGETVSKDGKGAPFWIISCVRR